MSQDNNFHQYGYDHYLKAPAKPSMQPRTVARHSGGKLLFAQIFRKLQTPAVATVALLGAGALFAGVIFMTYPTGDEGERQIPIIKADLRPIKTQPVERGGMSIPHRDSTILANVGQPRFSQSRIADENHKIENLLSLSNDDLVSKEQAIERAMEQDKMPVELMAQMKKDTVPVLLRSEQVSAPSETSPVRVPLKEKTASFDLKEPTAKDVLQKIGALENEMSEDNSEFSMKAASAATALKPNYSTRRFSSNSVSSSKSPDTIDFVRSVLNSEPAKIEPAAGAASVAANITAGMYFVQLASITDQARASKEWSKMQARYSSLSSAEYRVQEASLSSGTFYRIQAGPMSKESANEICNALKAAGKPGGCLVVK